MDKFDMSLVGGQLLNIPDPGVVMDASAPVYFGWVPPDDCPDAADLFWNSDMAKTGAQSRTLDRQKINAAHSAAMTAIPDFKISGSWQLEKRRYKLWEAPKKVLGHFLKYIWQITGSCVGAGGMNAGRTGMCCEIVAGEAEEYQEIWWPYTYGKSREESGIHTPGEGSNGSGWAAAATKWGSFAVKDVPELPAFREVEGWLQLDRNTEIKWSDGDAIAAKYNELAKVHLFKTAARLRSADDAIAALANYYCITQASMFGMRNMVPSVKGSTHPRRIGAWDGSWSHQTYIDEYDDNEEHGELFRWGNNWGPTAHGSTTADEPPGGVYLPKAVIDRICKTGEVYAFSMFAGFPARKLDWLI